MSLKNNLKNLIKGRVTLKDIYYYIQGNIRYLLYYSKFRFLIRNHICEQITWRISVMYIECYNNGECVKCGCSTTALQMCNKSCEGNCYPKMLSKKEWKQKQKELKIDYKNWYWSKNKNDFYLKNK